MTKIAHCCLAAENAITFRACLPGSLHPCILMATASITDSLTNMMGPAYTFEAAYEPIFFCPWCGKQLDKREKKEDS